ncbi:MAG TPA: hypothetical protein VGO61_07210 [Steroidobacteraceae bacterium]|jgi:hypothetical protein|nr:hypothetical protein [Steroidobacteraceae bacterium]
MKHRVSLGIALVACAAVEAAEPAPAKSVVPVTTAVAAPRSQPAKPLNLRIGDVRRYMMPNEYHEAISAPDAEQNTVVVEANRMLPSKSDRPVPVAIAAPFWALAHPLQSWRILVPDLKAPPPGPPDVVPPPVFRWGP